MPLLKSGSKAATSKNISEMVHSGYPQRQAVAAALSNARKYAKRYADGGEIEQPKLLETKEGFPFIQAGNAPPGPIDTSKIQPHTGEQVYRLGREAAGHVIQGYKDYFDPFTKDDKDKYVADQPIPQTPTGKVPQTQKDYMSPLIGGLDIGSNLIGVPTAVAAGVTKAGLMGMSGLKKAAPAISDQASKLGFQAAQMALEPGYIETSGFTKAGGQLGYMPGGFHLDPKTGTEWYLKQGPNIEQVKNEHLGAKLYELAGVPVAEVGITTVGGKPGIASKKIPDSIQLSKAKVPYQDIKGLHDNFVVDAWLGNYDAVGAGPENPLGNIMISGGQAYRIDPGGSLRFRGSGGLKSSFPDEANEVLTMRDPSYSELSARVFGDISDESLKIGAQKVANIDPMAISQMVAKYGPTDDAEKSKLLLTLLKRREDIMNRFGVKPGGSVTPPAPSGGISASAPKKKPESHPHLDENGEIVTIKDPDTPTPLGNPAWHNPELSVTITPASNTIKHLNGIPFSSIDSSIDLKPSHFKNLMNDSAGADVPFKPVLGKGVGAGVVIVEPDGRVWTIRPTNDWAGYKATFPKGTVSGSDYSNARLQETAIREAFEETGLVVKINGFLGDFERDGSKARYYIAERIGGNPSNMGWEAQSVSLVPQGKLKEIFNKDSDKSIADALTKTNVKEQESTRGLQETAPDEWWKQAEKDLDRLEIEDGARRPNLEDEMIGEKDFSQGSFRDDPFKQEPWTAEDAARWVPDDSTGMTETLKSPPWGKKINQEQEAEKILSSYLSTGTLKEINKFKIGQDWLNTSASKKLNPEHHKALSAEGNLDKKTAKQIAIALHSGPDSPSKSFETAAYLWQVADNIGPHQAEAIFRAFPEDTQKMIGRRISALKDDIGSSPWDNLNKKDGKFINSHALSHALPAHLMGDKEFLNGLKKAKGILGIEDVKSEKTITPKTAPIPKKNQKDKAGEYDMFVGLGLDDNNAKKAAYQLTMRYGTDSNAIGNILYRYADSKSPLHVDNIFKELPYNLQVDVLNKIEDMVKAKGDPWYDQKKGDWNVAQSYMNEVQPLKGGWMNYKPKYNDNLEPVKFGYVSKAFVRALGFNPELPLFHGVRAHNAPSIYKKKKMNNDPMDWSDIYYTELKDPKDAKGSFEPGIFTSDEFDIAAGYAESSKRVQKYIARSMKPFVADWKSANNGAASYSSHTMDQLVKAAHKKGADILIIEGINDEHKLGKQTQYVILKPEILRAHNAKFDPSKLHLRYPLAGVVGGGTFAYGTLKGEDNKMARGGTAAIDKAVRAAKHYASGGAPWNVRRSSHIPHGEGMIKSSIPGRTDRLPLAVKAGSFILPADIPSALGEGNTMAGEKILTKAMGIGPYGSGVTGKVKQGPKPKIPSARPIPLRRRSKGFAEGGETERVPIIAAGGEMIVEPETVMGIGDGDLDKGHKRLSKFVLAVRKKNIQTLRKLKPPKMS